MVLHRWDALAHTAALTAVNAEPEVMTFLNAGVPYSEAASREQSERFAQHWDQFGFGFWAVEAAGTLVGFVGVGHPIYFPAYVHEVEVGWRLHPSAWGKGYATEAGRAAVDAALEHLAVRRVIAVIDPGNVASIAVAERLGMTPAERAPDPEGPGELVIYEQRRR
ncbi:GNAT family N-acetyltransferase [Solirubrobacter phytolaccae]|uniref:GNAT family N-acetyltransferase n=1 Tax=Solirubrobacter phytolaccae TaxID=1404360 RepID=A0A9X3NI38_9ACTN|nr:GNAT family N-acetyltransferase [Solirubrobacter phytolaccae]MDA0184286.1 GNAT family N-acetyltransferase [Solirubrobacter phytolaccae]